MPSTHQHVKSREYGDVLTVLTVLNEYGRVKMHKLFHVSHCFLDFPCDQHFCALRFNFDRRMGR